MPQHPPKKRRRWLQFSLRTLFILLTAFAVWLGFRVNQANRQRRAVEALSQIGAEFCYDYQRGPSSDGVGYSYSYEIEPPGPEWLRGLLGEHFFKTAVGIKFSADGKLVDDDRLAHLNDLPQIEDAFVYGLRLQDHDLAHFGRLRKLSVLGFGKGTLSGAQAPEDFRFLSNCRRLEVLTLRAPKFSDDDLAQLSEATRLKQLFLHETSVGDEGLAALKKLSRLEYLGLARTKVTDNGLAHLTPLVSLKYLSLNETDISDAGLHHFESLANLTDLELHGTSVTKVAVENLRASMPNCSIKH